MSDFLDRMTARAQGQEAALRPRVPSRFEPLPDDSGRIVDAEREVAPAPPPVLPAPPVHASMPMPPAPATPQQFETPIAPASADGPRLPAPRPPAATPPAPAVSPSGGPAVILRTASLAKPPPAIPVVQRRSDQVAAPTQTRTTNETGAASPPEQPASAPAANIDRPLRSLTAAESTAATPIPIDARPAPAPAATMALTPDPDPSPEPTSVPIKDRDRASRAAEPMSAASVPLDTRPVQRPAVPASKSPPEPAEASAPIIEIHIRSIEVHAAPRPAAPAARPAGPSLDAFLARRRT
jgi:hypothetical protein